MKARLDHEYSGVVHEILSWGIGVTLDDGPAVLVDNVKICAPRPSIGDRIEVVILDDERSPARASMLEIDRALAAAHRAD